MFDVNLNLDFGIPYLIKYIHASIMKKKLLKRKYEDSEKKFIFSLNNLVVQEKEIILTLIKNRNTQQENCRNPFVLRLLQCNILYEIPNSHESIMAQRKNKPNINGFTVLATFYTDEAAPRLYVLNPDFYEAAKYLYEQKAIFNEGQAIYE